jgi:hypothetical protein
MGFAKIHGKLTSRIGCAVRFKAPQDVLRAGGVAGSVGRIVDEVWADPAVNDLPKRDPEHTGDWGDYSFCSQLIEWEDKSHTIRLAYYRRRAGEDYWEFASQMTINSEWRTIKPLLERTLARTGWFSDTPTGVEAEELSAEDMKSRQGEPDGSGNE